jgi:hypothetical protein
LYGPANKITGLQRIPLNILKTELGKYDASITRLGFLRHTKNAHQFNKFPNFIATRTVAFHEKCWGQHRLSKKTVRILARITK